MLRLVLAMGLLAAIPAAASAQDAEAGKAVFKKCAACHQFGKNAVGPDLKGVVGRKAGTHEGYAYSEAMKASGLTWDEATLTKYLTDPKGTVPKNKMVFVGIKDETELKNVIAYLGSQK